MKRSFLTAVLAIVACGTFAWADPEPETILGDLNNPTAVAIQPGTGHVFVADSGNARVIRIVDGKPQDVITDFTIDKYGKGPIYEIGPLGLAFLNKDYLVVGDGGKPDGEELVHVYKVPAAGAPAIKADQSEAKFNVPAEGDLKPEGNFYGLAVTKDGVYITSNGDDTKGWILKGTRTEDGTKVTGVKRHIATKEAVNVDAPVAITSRQVNGVEQLVVGQLGEVNVANDSLLSFYDTSGKLLLNLPTNLHDITGLAYSPKGALYATDFAWVKPADGGLFMLVREFDETKKQVCKTQKVLGLDKPTALAFASDGALYITVLGEPGKGKLLKIAPGL